MQLAPEGFSYYFAPVLSLPDFFQPFKQATGKSGCHESLWSYDCYELEMTYLLVTHPRTSHLPRALFVDGTTPVPWIRPHRVVSTPEFLNLRQKQGNKPLQLIRLSANKRVIYLSTSRSQPHLLPADATKTRNN